MTIIQSTKVLRERTEHDVYPTPYDLCDVVVSTIIPMDLNPAYVLDPGAGDGVWGKAVRSYYKNAEITGVEIRKVAQPKSYDVWYNSDYLNHPDILFDGYDLIIGNPPFNIAEKFVHHSLENLHPGGYVIFLLRLAFLESKKRYETLYASWNNGWTTPKEVYVSTRRVSFTGNQKSDDTPYGIFVWQNGWKGTTSLKWLDWKYAT